MNVLAVLTPPTATAMVTLDQAKRRLNLDSAEHSQDDFVTELIEAASAWFVEAFRRPVALQAITEALPTVDRLRLVLGMRPLVSISAIRFDGVALSTSDYSIEDRGASILFRSGGWFGDGGRIARGSISQNAWSERGEQLLQCDYRAGFAMPEVADPLGANETRLPLRLQQACLVLVQSWYLSRDRDPMASSARVGDVSGSWMDLEVPAAVQQVADAYADPLGF